MQASFALNLAWSQCAYISTLLLVALASAKVHFYLILRSFVSNCLAEIALSSFELVHLKITNISNKNAVSIASGEQINAFHSFTTVAGSININQRQKRFIVKKMRLESEQTNIWAFISLNGKFLLFLRIVY